MEIYINGSENEKKVLEDQYGKKYLCTLRDEFLTLNYLEENSKRCPKCLIKIEVSRHWKVIIWTLMIEKH